MLYNAYVRSRVLPPFRFPSHQVLHSALHEYTVLPDAHLRFGGYRFILPHGSRLASIYRYHNSELSLIEATRRHTHATTHAEKDLEDKYKALAEESKGKSLPRRKPLSRKK